MAPPSDVISTTAKSLTSILDSIKSRETWGYPRIPAFRTKEQSKELSHLDEWHRDACHVVQACLSNLSSGIQDGTRSQSDNLQVPFYEYKRIKTDLEDIRKRAGAGLSMDSPFKLPLFKLWYHPIDLSGCDIPGYSGVLVTKRLLDLGVGLYHRRTPFVSAADYVVFKRTSGFGALQDQVLRAVDNSWQSMSTQEQDGLLRDLFSLVWPSSHGQTQEVKAELQKRVDSVRTAIEAGRGHELKDSNFLGQLLYRAGFDRSGAAHTSQPATQLSIRKENIYFPHNRSRSARRASTDVLPLLATL